MNLPLFLAMILKWIGYALLLGFCLPNYMQYHVLK
jgi:hypothetical protein